MNRHVRNILALGTAAIAVLALGACGKKDKEAPKADTALAQNASQVEAYQPAPMVVCDPQEGINETPRVIELENGLVIKVLREGKGIKPSVTDLVKVHYEGRLTDGTVFDSSYARNEPITFPLNRVIEGWTLGLQEMDECAKAELTIPSELAYGTTGTPGGPIGPNETLVFDVELLKVVNPERNLAMSKAWLAENAQKDGVKVTASGLQYQIIKKGEGGAKPTVNDRVEVDYRGTLTDGTEFDSSYSRGQTATFGVSRVIPGWTEGLQLMEEGDSFRFFIPPDLAYGPQGTPSGEIGPNEVLIFDVELKDVKE